ncbi:MAG TPA: hypothetical protein VGG36_11610 [Rhizomicrobium sp.]|jgi:hypothetical protein
MTGQDHARDATAREWRIAMIVVAGGFAIAIAIALYFALQPAPAPTSQAPAASTTMTPEQRRQFALKVGKVLCDQEVGNAQSIGVVPAYGRSVGLPQKTGQRGRYVCTASTGVAKYAIAADVTCSTLLDPRCVRVYSVTSDDGTVLYKRPEPKPAK